MARRNPSQGDEMRGAVVMGATERGAIAAAVRVLRRGGVVVFPTETVYGVAVRAGDPIARRRLARIKEREAKKPFQILLGHRNDAFRRCPNMPEAARRLAKRFWPGPLTLVTRDSSGRWVGLRVPDHPVPRGLAKAVGGALVATSANLAGQPPASSAAQACEALGERVDLILDGGPAMLGRASSVVKVGARAWQMLREEAISRTDIEAVIQAASNIKRRTAR